MANITTTKEKTVNEEKNSSIRYSGLQTQEMFCEKFKFTPTGSGQERQRKQKKRLERTGKECGRYTEFAFSILCELWLEERRAGKGVSF